MKVTRLQIIEKGIACRCPNCGGRTLFERGRMFKVNPVCSACGMQIEKGDGAFLGPFVINYGVTAFGLVLPIFGMFLAGWIGMVPTLVASAVAALLVPLALYRLSWAWWLTLYYFFLPENLPANLEGRGVDDE